jgi:hypothetical protein
MKNQKVQIDLNPDHTPILYTDHVMIRASESGVVLDFCQAVGPGRFKVVSRTGMSKAQAHKFVEELSRTMAMATAKSKN